uniref:molybdopterin-dependent oxidoreductase n=1 Tax=Mesosutterella multiformis TaxID=2259133 RepID=UPI004026BEE6
MAAGLPMMPVARAVAEAVNSKDACTWCACVINCGQRCALRVFSHNGQVIRIETDNTQPDTLGPRQLRACQRGRSMRERIYSPDRLRFPMKRVGERGEGKFERISWDEALDTIAKEWTRIKNQYGNDSIYWQYCSGQQSLVSSRRAWAAPDEPDGRVPAVLRLLLKRSRGRGLPEDLRRPPEFPPE